MESAPRNLFFFELCRLCLLNEGVVDLFVNKELIDDILTCTGVKVSAADNLPRKICNKCSEVVKNWKDLRQVACKNDENLRALFGSFQNDDSDCDDIIKISAVPSQETPSKPEASISLNNQNSSKEKLSMLLEAGEENTECAPVIRQAISVRNDLLSPSITVKDKESQNHTKKKTYTEKTEHDKLLRLKVEEENRCKKVKSDDDEVIEYVCATCCKGFDTYKKFYLHQRLHNKKIHCPFDACSKKFATKGDLQKHLRTHTGEKPFLCKICDKGFTQRVSLRSHVTSVHPDVKELKDENGCQLQTTDGARKPTRAQQPYG